MGVMVMTDKQAVKTIYAAIVRQALDDWKVACRHDDRARKAERSGDSLIRNGARGF